METTVEVLTTRKPGREVHRHWPDEVKAQIVSESLRPGAMVNEVAERYGFGQTAFQLGARWRGKASWLPAPEDAVESATVIVDPPVSEPPIKKTSRPEIIVGAVTIRLEEGASAGRLSSNARSK
ncbi:transposase [Rhizobium leguminosarum]|uniref:transposase n=1 Tax=Rhizobium leguminosarum TaxID=384 RepID=UPI001FEEADD7|nr:transposase [Rhizobium leguminosarum]